MIHFDTQIHWHSLLFWVVNGLGELNIFLLSQKIGNSVLKDDYEPPTYASIAGKFFMYFIFLSTYTVYHSCLSTSIIMCFMLLTTLHFCVDVSTENTYGDDEGEARTYLLPGAYDSGLTSKLSHKKKHPVPQRMNGTRPYEIGSDMPYEPFLESKPGNHQFMTNGKRTADFLSIPIKRIRTAARPRVVSPFPAGASGTPQFTSKTDASSGDTNSCQDDQSSLHGGSFSRKNADIESTVDFDRQLLYDGSEVSTKSKKKKKSKHPGYKTPQSVAESCSLMAPGKVSSLCKIVIFVLLALFDRVSFW